MNNVKKIIDIINSFPGISLKNAEKLAIYFIENKFEVNDMLEKIIELTKELEIDNKTGLITNDSTEEPNQNRDKDILYIVESNKEVINVVDKLNTTNSMFLLNLSSKRDYQNLEKINILLERLVLIINEYGTKEIIFMLTPSIETELIIRIIKDELKNSKVLNSLPKLSKLSMGIPFGGSIEYSDQRTMKGAIDKREEI